MNLLEALHHFEESLYDGQVKTNTRRWYIWFDQAGQIHGKLQSLYQFCGNVAVGEVDALLLNRWLKSLHGPQLKFGHQRPAIEGRYSANTINGHIAAVKRFFVWLQRVGLVADNPAGDLRRIPLGDRQPKAIATADFLRLLTEAKKSQSPKRNLAILTFLFDTGTRIGGLARITMNDLELNQKRVFVREKGRGWNGSGRWLFLEGVTLLCLRDYLAVRPADRGEQLFLLKSSGIYQMIERLAQSANVEGVCNPHAFRHAAAREWLRGGASLPAVSQLLGHKDITTTAMYYARWANSELQAIKHEASPLSNGLASIVKDALD